MAKISRKSFLKISGTTIVGGMAAYYGLPNLTAKEKETSVEEIVPSFCEVCFWKCGIQVHKRNGIPYKITGHPNHPLSNGMLCPRGVGGLGMLEDPDRLKKPLIRVKKNGKQAWKPVSWDEALEYTAKRMLELRDKYGPEQMGYFSHGHGAEWFSPIINAYGTDNQAHPSYDQCRGPRDEGFYFTLGSTPGSPERLDLANSRCIAFIGSHLGENMHNTQVQDISIANKNGAVFITVDPRQSMIATKSKYWLPIKPATDQALLLAWANVLIEENIYQKKFVAQNVVGFDKFAKHVKQFTPEWASKITEIEPDVIRKTARELAKAAPAAMIHPGRHVVWYGDDSQRSRLIAILNSLLGNWKQKGGFLDYGGLVVPKYPIPPFPERTTLSNSIMDKYSALTSHVRAQGIVDSSLPLKDEPYIHSWFVYACNLPTTLGDTQKIGKIMEQVDFTVVIDTMPAEVTGYADVVLPECTYLERYDDLHIGTYSRPFIALRQPLVEPMYDTKPGWWIAKKLAEKLDKELEKQGKEPEFSQYYPWNSIEEYLDKRLNGIGTNLESMKKVGVITGATVQLYTDPSKLEFETPSGKIEFYSQFLAENGHDPMPVYVKHPEPPKGMYRLITGRTPVHTFTRTTNNRRLLRLCSENTLWINTDVANMEKLSNGQKVQLENQDGVKAGPIKVMVTARIRKDCVYIVHGFGREDKRLTASYNVGINDSRLFTNLSIDPLMGGTGFRNNFVKIIK